jgi:hypothetical protein
MKKQVICPFLLALFILCHASYSQDVAETDAQLEVTELFASESILPIKLSYSNKDVNKETNDSTYIKTELSYLESDGNWRTFPVDIRARGNFRRKNCYFVPIKMKIDKKVSEGTLFEGNKSLKLVMPCLLQKNTNDNIVKEYMAYKLFEVISPYHFKTKMLAIDLEEQRNKKIIPHAIKGFFIEDDKKVAARHHGNVLERFVHPLQQDAVASVQNAIFQYMIGNTDYSTAYQHNGKLLFIDKRTIPLPYDFDMAGLINASYSVVSQIQGETLEINKVTDRIYRGFKRDDQVLRQVRQEFLDNKPRMMAVVDGLQSNFDDPKEFATARKFIADFFVIIEDDAMFKKEIVDRGRTK